MDDHQHPSARPDPAQMQALQDLVALRDELLELNTRLEYLRLVLRLQQPRPQ
ncbi:hypothetical protein RA210_U10247 [Rubrivivax sp. A210]|uniref:hypothetical protein n=1 Tax=Rubrivivax sp. A210 TaxID=2772301 RepID=UPI00191B3CB7|nr:hypothetical protein [Rubrivivax sp. A210]CAD5366282.1 hypothetical protein RA210_U10247 [Rubrivivax sp. A210]